MSTLTREEAMAYEKVSESTIRRWEKSGLKHHRKGNIVRHKIEWIDEFMGRNIPVDQDTHHSDLSRRKVAYRAALAKL
jgi:hypothetical protein